MNVMTYILFPAPAGMNRPASSVYLGPDPVPHPRGDEPEIEVINSALEDCSPPPRG